MLVSSFGSLPKCLRQPGLGHANASVRNFIHVSQVGGIIARLSEYLLVGNEKEEQSRDVPQAHCH